MSCFVIGSHTLKWIDASHTLRSAGVPSLGDWNNFMFREGRGKGVGLKLVEYLSFNLHIQYNKLVDQNGLVRRC